MGDQPRSSRLEAQIFDLLNFVLGGGEQDLKLPSDGRMHLDMRFRMASGVTIGLEYDGAYWHAGNEAADQRKAHRVVADGIADLVVRIREEPLAALSPYDVVIRHKESAPTVVIATLLHLVHMDVLDAQTADHISAILVTSRSAPRIESITCDECWLLDGSIRHAEYGYRRNEIKRRRAARRVAEKTVRRASQRPPEFDEA
ncbi:hypothetical protein JCM9803A_16000 [Rhodococcus erythropolis]